MSKRFALVGAAGYIAPRHMKAIKDTGNELSAAFDVNDSVGVIDSYFPEAEFFTEFELFDAFIREEGCADRDLDFVSIASPNHLHAAHMQWGLRAGSNVICEKPLVLYPRDLDNLGQVEKETGNQIFTILQLRLHPAILALREKYSTQNNGHKVDVDLTYITSRGNWYLKSWKGDLEKSGGIATNIGVHFFDMLHFVFGDVVENKVHLNTSTKAAGYIEYEGARVRWFLSLDVNDVPADERAAGKRTYRAIIADGVNVEFSDGFTELHTRVYEDILRGGGFGLEANRVAIETVSDIRHSSTVTSGEYRHPFGETCK